MSIDDLFSEDVLQKASMFEVKMLTSAMWLSGPDGYVKTELPQEAQYSPLYALLIDDVDGDGVMDLIAGGNQYQVKPQFGRYDASQGWFFKGVRKNGTYSLERGIALGVRGQIRDIKIVSARGEKYLFFARYDDELEIRRVAKCLN
jgi:hypothetical protein